MSAPTLAKADLSDSRITLNSPRPSRRATRKSSTPPWINSSRSSPNAKRIAKRTPPIRTRAPRRPPPSHADQKVRNANTTPQGPATAPANPNAKINFKSMEVDFGDVYSTNPVPGTFEFTSRYRGSHHRAGPHDLRLHLRQRSRTPQPRWEPGTASIDFTFTPAQKAGLQSKNIIVITNSEENRTISLTLKANYIPAVKTSSQTATFGRVEAGNIGQPESSSNRAIPISSSRTSISVTPRATTPGPTPNSSP